jgi:hypothetical protein
MKLNYILFMYIRTYLRLLPQYTQGVTYKNVTPGYPFTAIFLGLRWLLDIKRATVHSSDTNLKNGFHRMFERPLSIFYGRGFSNTLSSQYP